MGRNSLNTSLSCTEELVKGFSAIFHESLEKTKRAQIRLQVKSPSLYFVNPNK